MKEKISYKNKITAAELNALRESVGWKPYEQSAAETVVKHSCFAAAYCGGVLCGAARWFWDGGAVAVMCDVMVLPEYGGAGIGKSVVRHALQNIKNSLPKGGEVTVYLMSAKGKEPFYEKCGFTVRPNEDLGAGVTVKLCAESE